MSLSYLILFLYMIVYILNIMFKLIALFCIANNCLRLFNSMRA